MKYVFADEAGDCNVGHVGVSRYFILCTVLMDDCVVGDQLQALRRELAWSGVKLDSYFHASEDEWDVRNRVYDLLVEASFSIQVTIMKKARAFERVKKTKPDLYRYAWFYHLRHGLIRRGLHGASEVLITSASIGTGKEKAAFTAAMNRAVADVGTPLNWVFEQRPASTDPCLQIADYCAWAVQRKYHSDESRLYDRLFDKIDYEYDLWPEASCSDV